MKPISEWTDDELRQFYGRCHIQTAEALAVEVLRLRGEVARLEALVSAPWLEDED